MKNDILEWVIVVCLGIIIGGCMFGISLKMGWI
jgi:hypothetical protein